MTKLVMKSIGMLISMVAIFSVEAAGRLAFRIFTSAPSRKPASEKEAEAVSQAVPRLAKARQMRLVIEGAVVAAYDFAPQGKRTHLGKVLVVHGYKSRSEHMLSIVDTLTEAGFQVVAIDMPGHGHSTGQQSHLLNAVQAIDAAWREFEGFDAFIGHSFGGAAVIVAAAGSIPSVPARVPQKLITIAAPTKLKVIFSWFATATGLSPRIKTAFYGQVFKLAGKPLSAFDTSADLSGITADTLVLHAPDDKEVPFVCAEMLAASGPHVKMKPLAGLGHRRILAAPAMLEELKSFLSPTDAGIVAETVAISPPMEQLTATILPEVRRIA